MGVYCGVARDMKLLLLYNDHNKKHVLFTIEDYIKQRSRYRNTVVKDKKEQNVYKPYFCFDFYKNR